MWKQKPIKYDNIYLSISSLFTHQPTIHFKDLREIESPAATLKQPYSSTYNHKYTHKRAHTYMRNRL